MGKRLKKAALLDEILLERKKLEQLLDALSPRVVTKRGRNESDWSIKDVITHLIDWEHRGNQWYESGKRGEEVFIPAKDFGWGDIKRLNEKIFKTNRRLSLVKANAAFAKVHQETLEAIDGMTDPELTELNYYPWTGKSWVLSDYIRANTASHYRWATKKIRKWLKAAGELP